jgi:hypothetical protein
MVRKFKLFCEGFTNRATDEYLQDVLNIAADENYKVNINERDDIVHSIHIYNSDNVNCGERDLWDNDTFIRISENIYTRIGDQFNVYLSSWDTGSYETKKIDQIEDIAKFSKIIILTFLIKR